MKSEPEKVDLGSISILIPASKADEGNARAVLFTELKGYLEAAARSNMDPRIQHKIGASDIVQNSFLRVIENFDQFRGKTSGELKAWIKSVVKNEIKGACRALRTNKRNVAREVPIAPGTSTAPGFTLADANSTPSTCAIRQEQSDRVHEILAELNPDDAQVIQLKNIESLSFSEIAVRMNRSESAASQLWYRAVLKFEEKLRASGDFEPE